MSIFSSIMNKIFHPAAGSETPAPAPDQAASATPSAVGAPDTSPAPAAGASGPVDVEAVLTQMASQKGGGGNWRTSIVDLLKLLDLDSSLSARTELGNELNVHAAAEGTAEQNIALHKAVMQKLAENGGKVPDSMKG